MTRNYLGYRIADMTSTQHKLELSLSEFPVRGQQSATVADNVRIATGHVKRAIEYLEKARLATPAVNK
jgi:hypothetical protein